MKYEAIPTRKTNIFAIWCNAHDPLLELGLNIVDGSIGDATTMNALGGGDETNKSGVLI